jgi:hypothetical protein
MGGDRRLTHEDSSDDAEPMTLDDQGDGVETPDAPLAPEAPEAPAGPFDAAPANDTWSPADRFDETPMRGPASRLDTIPSQSPQELLRRAALGSVDSPGPEAADDEDPDSWADPASLRELRMLTRIGALAAVCTVPAAIYWFGDGRTAHSSWFVLMLFLGGVGFLLMMCLLLVGVMATLRRGELVLLVLGIVFSPFVYSVWALVLLTRIRGDGGLSAEDA